MTGLKTMTVRFGAPFHANPHQQLFGRDLGKYRDVVNNVRGAKPIVVQDPFEIRSNHQAGGLLETAVSLKLNLCPMLQFDTYYQHNLQLPGGDTMNVQWNHPDGVIRLDCAREAKRQLRKRYDPPDLYLVFTGDQTPTKRLGYIVFYFAGWATHAEVLAAPIETNRYGPYYACRPRHRTLEIVVPLRGSYYDPDCFDFQEAI